MLQSIYIKNLYLIDEINLEFGSGLNILTGETGAGKSIILGAIGLILGDKADTTSVRTGFNKGIVETVFNISKMNELKKILEEKGVTIEDDTLIIKREISVDGKSKAFINMSNVMVSTLKEIGEYLVDISGQHQHHSLLKVSNHIQLLDSFARTNYEVSEFGKLWREYLNKTEELNNLIEKEKEKEKTRELAQFSIDEIEKAKLNKNEEKELDEELKRLMNYQKLTNSLKLSYNTLYENTNAIIPSTETVIGELEKISSLDINMTRVLEETKEALYKLESVKDYIRSYKDSLDFSPDRLDEINERLDVISTIKKKYGGSIESAIQHKKTYEETIEQIEKNEEQIEKLQSEIKQLESKIKESAVSLSKKRQRSAKELERKVIEELSYLGMSKAKFKVEFRYIENSDSFLKITERGVRIEETGIDKIEFTISANLGEEPKPLTKIASGGELSRIMLAIKNILINMDTIGTVVFDEVDAGIGGETAVKVANKIKEMSRTTQVICITHSPQIASKGDYNYLVEKLLKEGRTISIVRKIDEDIKIKEIARMLGGDNITDITIQHAKELINKK
jgi:DNA repair protein RecN (Recombination protein N)